MAKTDVEVSFKVIKPKILALYIRYILTGEIIEPILYR